MSDATPAEKKTGDWNFERCKKIAQAIYDHRGEPPYLSAPRPGLGLNSAEALALAAETEILSDFVKHWMPYLNKKDKK